VSSSTSDSPSQLRLALRDGGRVLLVSLSEIDFVEASGNYVEVNVGSSKYLHRETMREFAERLPSDRFARVHRSTIVNLDRIRKLHVIDRGEYEIELENGMRFDCNLSYTELKTLIEGGGGG